MNAIRIGLYALALLTCLACTVLLVLRYRRSRVRLLLWSSLCFAALTVNNALLFVDLVMLPAVDLRLYRYAAALAGMLCLLVGFIWEADH